MVRRKGCFVFALVWSTWGAVLMAQAQVTRYVDPGNAKCSDKTGTPFCTIQSAILASNHGDTVLLADGEYVGPDNRNLVFGGRRITVASVNGPANCVINCESLGRGFLFGAGENEESVLRGVTIRHGFDDYAGGGIFCDSAPTLENLIIEDCRAPNYGGGIFVQGGGANPLIRDTLIRRNQSLSGAGVFVWEGASLHIEDSIVEDNGRFPGTPPIETEDGGGIFVDTGGQHTVRDCIIRRNRCAVSGGGVLLLKSAIVDITGCTIAENEAGGDGGGLGTYYVEGPTTSNIFNTRIVANRAGGQGGGLFVEQGYGVVANTLIDRNTADQDGGGFYAEGANAWTFGNCTITANVAELRGGGMALKGLPAPLEMANSIVWGNVSDDDNGHQLHVDGGTVPDVRFSNIQRRPAPQGMPAPNDIVGVNLNADINHIIFDSNPLVFRNIGNAAVQDFHAPYFAAAGNPLNPADPWEDDNYGLQRPPLESQAPHNGNIDSGSNSLIPFDLTDVDGNGITFERVPLDLAVAARVWNDPETPNTGEGEQDCRVVERGAYELIVPECPPARIVRAELMRIPSGQPPVVEFAFDPAQQWPIDARQPHDVGSPTPRTGLGSPDEPIAIILDGQGSTAPGCWDLCELRSEVVSGGGPVPNHVVSVTESQQGVAPGHYKYALTLARPIRLGGWTTISYSCDPDAGGQVNLGHLPADAIGDRVSNPFDILRIIDYLNQVAVPPFGIYSKDMDHSGVFNTFDILRVVDLLNGAGEFDPWLGRGIVGGNCGGQLPPGATDTGPTQAFSLACMELLTETAIPDPDKDPEGFTVYLAEATDLCQPVPPADPPSDSPPDPNPGPPPPKGTGDDDLTLPVYLPPEP